MKKPDFKVPDLDPTSVKELRELLSSDALRLKVYEYMADYLIERKLWGFSAGLCHCVPSFIRDVYDDNINTRLRSLPELWKYKPKFRHMDVSYWLPDNDYDVRLTILNFIITKLKKKINVTNS